MYSSCIRSFSLFSISFLAATATASGPTWALPHAQPVKASTFDLSGGYAQFPQGGLAVARLSIETPINYGAYGSFMAHEWAALDQLNQRFIIAGLGYRVQLSRHTAIAPFMQSVYFDGGSALDRRLTARAGLAFERSTTNWAWDLSLPIVGAKSFPMHPTDPDWSRLGVLDLLLATETGLTWKGWSNHQLRLGLMGTLARLSYQARINAHRVSAQLATMGSHSFALLGWGCSWPDELSQRR